MRLARLVRRLEKFSFPLVAAPLAGLLTRRENHTATSRIEALIHLAALACRGDWEPGQRQLREWLNVAICNDPITEIEIPVEDVFVSNVDAWFGNVRLFEGRWQNNGEYVRACVETLLRIQEQPWALQTLGHVMALLRVSEAVAERAGIARNSRTASRPGVKIAVGVSTVRLRLKVTSLIRKSEARETGCRPESRCEHTNAPDADPLAARDTGRKGSRTGGDGSTRRKSPDGAVGSEGGPQSDIADDLSSNRMRAESKCGAFGRSYGHGTVNPMRAGRRSRRHRRRGHG